jgi:iron complex outermembrane recepter protein
MPRTLAALPLAPRAPHRLTALNAACALALATLAALAPRTASAQAEGTPTPAATVLDPVVITGSRVERKAFDVPQSISTLSADDLHNAGPQINLSEAMARVPGLTVSNRNNYAQDLQMSSRGFGARSSFGVRGLRLYTDGIPATMPDGSGQVSHFDLANAQRIEVLRGPFSALYGNSSGGVIALFTAPARQREFKLEGDVGTFGTQLLRTSVAAPLDGGWDVQANWTGFETEGFRPQSAAQRRSANARIGWRDERNTVTALMGRMAQPAQDALGLTRAQFTADPYQTTPQALTFNTRKDLSQTQGGVNWQHRFEGSGALRDSTLVVYDGKRSVTQWQSIPVAVQAPATHPGGVIDFDRHYRGIDGRLHWQWSDATQLVAGVNAEHQSDERRGYENFIGTTLGVTGAPRRDESNRARNTDLYAQGEHKLTPTVLLSAGVRTGRIRYTTTDAYLGNGDDSGSRSFSYTNPVAGLSWKLQPQWNLYVSAGRGFEAPTLTELAYRADGSSGFNDQLEAQTSHQFELGSKWRQLDLGLSLDAAVFRTETRNEIGVAANRDGRTTFKNVGRTRREGVEVAGRWDPDADWRAQVALTWLSARYRDSDLAPAGNRIAGTTPRNAFAEVVWRPLSLGAGWVGTELGLDVRGQDRTMVNDTNTDSSGGFAVWGLRASKTLALDSRTSFDLFGRVDNATNKVYAGSVIVNEGNSRFFEPGAPRAWLLGARLTARF